MITWYGNFPGITKCFWLSCLSWFESRPHGPQPDNVEAPFGCTAGTSAAQLASMWEKKKNSSVNHTFLWQKPVFRIMITFVRIQIGLFPWVRIRIGTKAGSEGIRIRIFINFSWYFLSKTRLEFSCTGILYAVCPLVLPRSLACWSSRRAGWYQGGSFDTRFTPWKMRIRFLARKSLV